MLYVRFLASNFVSKIVPKHTRQHYNINISQDSVAICLKCGGTLNGGSIANFQTVPVKEFFLNWTIFDESMVKCMVSPVF